MDLNSLQDLWRTRLPSRSDLSTFVRPLPPISEDSDFESEDLDEDISIEDPLGVEISRQDNQDQIFLSPSDQEDELDIESRKVGNELAI